VDQGENSTSRPSPDVLEVELRQLALIDKILGLEAEVARLSAVAPFVSAREEIEKMSTRLNALYNSTTWRVGTAVLRPIQVLQNLWRCR
jgi:hypothetical protein